jgi:hypothetical protein
MMRRDFIKLIGASAAMWPVAARAQQATPVVVGTMAWRKSQHATAGIY